MNRLEQKALTPALSEARLARQYDAIRARVRPRSGSRAWLAWSLAFTATAALVAVWFTLHHPAASDAWLVDGAVLESGAAGDTAHLTLAEGSRVDLAPHTRARLTSARANAIRIDVEVGRVEVEATHVEGRTFVVGAGAYEVRVVGTHFVVDRAPGERVTVSVARGVVEVAGVGGDTRRLIAGEQWSAPDGALSTAPASKGSSSTPDDSSDGPSGALAPSVLVPLPTPSATTSAPQPDETAKGLFDEAQHARADGRPQDAARAFDRLRRAFRRDRRASLAAFELGRLRLDALGDPRGAEEAFRDAMALGGASPFREDAEARRVEALARMGDMARCGAARDAYLARWPSGTYRRAVGLYCGGR